MSTTLHDASVPVFLHYLGRLGGFLEAGEAFAYAQGRRPDELLAARLAPDMLPLERQFVIAINFSLRSTFPLAGEPIPPYGEFEPTFAGLRERCSRAARLLASLEPRQFAGGEERVVESQAGEALVRLPAREFLLLYALPNFFFHVTTAYALLRGLGVPLGKQDFDGFHAYPREP